MLSITFNLSLGEAVTILISVLSLCILIYIWLKDKPALDVEKHSLKVKEVTMGARKDGVVGGPSGPAGSKCKNGANPCSVIKPS